MTFKFAHILLDKGTIGCITSQARVVLWIDNASFDKFDFIRYSHHNKFQIVDAWMHNVTTDMHFYSISGS
jgi:hypothetical protein